MLVLRMAPSKKKAAKGAPKADNAAAGSAAAGSAAASQTSSTRTTSKQHPVQQPAVSSRPKRNAEKRFYDDIEDNRPQHLSTRGPKKKKGGSGAMLGVDTHTEKVLLLLLLPRALHPSSCLFFTNHCYGGAVWRSLGNDGAAAVGVSVVVVLVAPLLGSYHTALIANLSLMINNGTRATTLALPSTSLKLAPLVRSLSRPCPGSWLSLLGALSIGKQKARHRLLCLSYYCCCVRMIPDLATIPSRPMLFIRTACVATQGRDASARTLADPAR